jgi:FkbM family methyltransferase
MLLSAVAASRSSMTLFLRRLFRWLARLASLAHLFGWRGAIRLMVLSRFGSDRPSTLYFRPLQRPLHYRRRSDASPLIELANPSYRIVDTDSPRPVRWIIDGGANIGDSTLRFRAQHPQATILAIEAEPTNHQLLAQTFANDPLTRALHLALWHQPTTLHLQSTWANVAFRVTADQQQGQSAVRAVTIPDLMAEHGIDQIDILKLDIEGAESVVFQTQDTAWIRRIRCLIFECCDQDDTGTTTRVFRALEAAGVDFDWHIAGECLVLLRPGIDWIHVPDDTLSPQLKLLPHLQAKAAAARVQLSVQESE